MHQIKHNLTKAQKRKRRVRGKVRGTASRPRVTVYRSNRYTYLQAIDDMAGETIAAANDLMLSKAAQKGTKTDRAEAVAKALADKLSKKKIKQVAFDRGSYRYHGRVRTVADTLRDQGITL
jgi:large subunit ribosomal protein L18